jgi:hypothetical protein
MGTSNGNNVTAKQSDATSMSRSNSADTEHDTEAEPPDLDRSSEQEEEKKCILTIIIFLKFIWTFRRFFKCINGRSKRTSCPS